MSEHSRVEEVVCGIWASVVCACLVFAAVAAIWKSEQETKQNQQLIKAMTEETQELRRMLQSDCKFPAGMPILDSPPGCGPENEGAWYFNRPKWGPERCNGAEWKKWGE